MNGLKQLTHQIQKETSEIYKEAFGPSSPQAPSLAQRIKVRCQADASKRRKIADQWERSHLHKLTIHDRVTSRIKELIKDSGLQLTNQETLEKFLLVPIIRKVRLLIQDYKRTNAQSSIWDFVIKRTPSFLKSAKTKSRLQSIRNLAVKIGEIVDEEVRNLFPNANGEDRLQLKKIVESNFISKRVLGGFGLEASMMAGILAIAFFDISPTRMMHQWQETVSKASNEALRAIHYEQHLSPETQAVGIVDLKEGINTKPDNENPMYTIQNLKPWKLKYPGFICNYAYKPDPNDLTFEEAILVNENPIQEEPDLILTVLPIGSEGSKYANLAKTFLDNPLTGSYGESFRESTSNEEYFGIKKGELINPPFILGYSICKQAGSDFDSKFEHVSGSTYRAKRDLDPEEVIEIPLKYKPELSLQKVELLKKPFFEKYTKWEEEIREELRQYKNNPDEVLQILDRYLAGPDGDNGMVYISPSSQDKNLMALFKELTPYELRELMFGFCSHSSAYIYGLIADIVPTAILAGQANVYYEHDLTEDHTEFVGPAGHAKIGIHVAGQAMEFETTGKGMRTPFSSAALGDNANMEKLNALLKAWRNSSEEEKAAAFKRFRATLLDQMIRNSRDIKRPSAN